MDLDVVARADEVHGLSMFLEKFWGRASGEDVPLEYIGKAIKVNIILVARSKTEVEVGTVAYISRAKTGMSHGLHSIYVTGRAKDEGFLEQVIKELKTHMPEKFEWMRRYRLRRQSTSYDAIIAFFRS